MAVTSIWSVKGWLGKLVVYVENPEKCSNPQPTGKRNMEKQQREALADVIDYAASKRKTSAVDDETLEVMERFVSGINCAPATARTEMLAVKRRFGKDEGIMAYHGYQSFAPGEATPAMAHEIGVKLAQRLWGKTYQVLVATHLDKENHLHNHFVVNTVSLVNGLRYHRTAKDYHAMRQTSDDLCREYGLSVIENPKQGKGKHYGEWRAEQEGRPTWRGLIKADVDEAIAKARTEKQFFSFLREKGYAIKLGEDITVRPPGKERGLKLARNFGEDYSQESICRRILAQPGLRPQQKLAALRLTAPRGKKPSRKIGGLRGLYLHYCYFLGIFPQNRNPKNLQLPFALREDLLKLNTIVRETRLLCRHRIDTTEQLFSYQKQVEGQINGLTETRKHLRYQIRSLEKKEPAQAAAVKAEISRLSGKLRNLREEVKLCQGIFVRSREMKEKVTVVRQEKRKEREVSAHDQRRGSSRSNR